MILSKHQLASGAYIIDPEIGLDDIRQHFLDQDSSMVSLFEFGIGSVRFDLIRVDCHHERIKIFEFKTSLPDFKRDKKWSRYLKYCNTLTFVTPRQMISTSSLPKEVGILYLFKYKSERYGATKEFRIGGVWERRPRSREVEPEIYKKIISLMLQRAKYRAGEIF